MAKSHEFTRNSDDSKVNIVIAHIQSYERDNFSECTSLKLSDGTTEGVKETIEEVKKIVDGK